MPEPVAIPDRTDAGEFRLDVDLAEQAVQQLVKVRDDLTVLRAKAALLSRQARSDRSTRDLVSLEAFAVLAERADGAPGALGPALDAGIVQVQGVIDQMNADIAKQRETDADSARALRS